MKRVLLTSNLFHPNIGGIENSLMNLAKEYSALGYQVDLLCSDMNNINNDTLPDIQKLEPNITVYRYRCKNVFIPKSIFMYFSAFKLFKKFSCFSYELILSRYHFTTLIAKLAGFKNITYLLPGIVKIQRKSERVGVNDKLLKKTARKVNDFYHHILQWLAIRTVDRIAVFSINMVKQINSVFSITSDEITVIKPGVNLDKFKVSQIKEKKLLQKQLGVPSNKTILLGLGRFVGSKSYDRAIEAVASLPEEFHLILVGDGPERSEYIKLIATLKLEKNVTVFDRTSQPEQYFKCADIFLMTSQYETLGQTIIEAQSCGLPIVSFTPSNRIKTAVLEVTQEYTRELAQNDDSASLALAIKSAYEKLNDDEFSANKISKYACENFSWRALSEELVNISNSGKPNEV